MSEKTTLNYVSVTEPISYTTGLPPIPTTAPPTRSNTKIRFAMQRSGSAQCSRDHIRSFQTKLLNICAYECAEDAACLGFSYAQEKCVIMSELQAPVPHNTECFTITNP